MNIINRLLGIDKKVEEQLSAAVDQRLKAVLPAAVAERLSAASISLDNEAGWRLLNGQSTRELLIAPYEQQIIMAYWLYKTNPLAGFLVDTPAAFIAADAMPYSCNDERIEELMQAFWDRNRLELRWGNYMKEQSIFGNLVLTAHVAEQTGRVKLGYLDPGLISTTICDPEDVQTKIGVKIKATEIRGERILKVILDKDTEEDLSLPAQALREQMTDGQCFLLQVNCMSSELLGTSDLFNVGDHLDSYEQTMIDAGEKHSQFNAFYYDITVEGADAKQLEQERQLYTPPRTGGAFIHNEKVKCDAVAPDLKALDAETATRFQRRHILGAKNIPNHWYADPDGSNRATADAMDRPTLMNFTRRQNEAKAVLKTIADFVITSALEARYLNVPEEEAYKYAISTPPLTDKDVAKLSTMLRDVSTSLVVAQTQGWIDDKKAGQMFAFCLAMLGFEYDPEENSEIPSEGKDYKNAKFAPGEATDTPAAPRTGADA
jgi:hypothetical protein